MSKLVRAEDPGTGATFTTSEAFARRKGLKYREGGALDDFGRVRRPTPRTDKSGSNAPRGDEKKEGAK